MQSTEPEHGTLRSYNKARCRCDECRAANREAQRLYRLKRYGDRAHRHVDGYRAVHGRLARTKGKASAHVCEFCGRQADDWALILSAAGVMHAEVGGTMRSWSDNPDDYQPLCRRCHRRYDSGWIDPTVVPAGHRLGRDRSRISGKCLNGHDLTVPGATRPRWWDGYVECVECARDRTRRYRARKARHAEPA